VVRNEVEENLLLHAERLSAPDATNLIWTINHSSIDQR